MSRSDSIRSEIQRLLRTAPFHPFALVMENGDRVVIEHPENIAFDPGTSGGVPASEEFYVISRRPRFFSTFSAVTSVALVALVDRGELVA